MTSEWCAWPTRGEGLRISADAHRSSGRCAETAAISHHQRLQDQRRRGDSRYRAWPEYTDGIRRINIELSLRNKLKLCDAPRVFERGNLPLGKPGCGR